MDLIERKCAGGCGSTFRVLPTSPNQFCSQACASGDGGGEFNPWKGNGKNSDIQKVSLMSASFHLGIPASTLRSWAKQGKIPFIRGKGKGGICFDLDAVKRAIESRGLRSRGFLPDVECGAA